MSSTMDGRADSQGLLCQATGDQHVTAHHRHRHYGGAAPVAADPPSAGTEAVRQPTAGRAPVVLRDRTELMERLHAAVEPGQGDRIHVLHGTGGCGKTAVAHSLFQYATDVTNRVGLWVNASDSVTLRGGMLAVAADRGAEEGELLAARSGLRPAADLVWDRLDESGQPWLLVLDNADGPALLRDGWLRSSPRGTVVVTTRQPAEGWGAGAQLHHVGALPGDAAAQILCDLAPRTETSDEEAKAVAERLGRLPLALTLAGGFLARQVTDRWTMSEYGSHLDGPEPDGPADRGTVSVTSGEGSRGLVSRTWQLPLDALTAQGLPESTVLLRLLARFAADDPLPLALLNGLGTDGVLPRERAGTALRGLLDQSLVTLVDTGVRCVQTHRVLLADVAAVTPPEAEPELTRAAVGLLDAAVPAVPERGPQDVQLRLLAPHALALLGRARGAGAVAEALDVAVRLAVSLHRTGDHISAWELASASAAAAEPELGAEHRLVLTARSREGRALFRLGRIEEAEALLRRVLEERERLFGTDDADTLDSYHGLSLPLQQSGRSAEALSLLRRVTEGRHKALGPGHPLTLRSRSALLACLPVLELAAEVDGTAVPLPRDCARHLGADSDETLGARLSYASALFRLDRVDEADEEARAAALEHERRYGPDAPATLSARTLYARTRAALGDAGSAIELMTEVVRRRERGLGADHPHTAASRRYSEEFEAMEA